MITGINHITLAVTDIHKSFDFYQNILGFKPLVKWDKGAYFLIGQDLLEKPFWFCLNVDPKRIPMPCYTHYAFSVAPHDFEKTRDKLLKANVPFFKDNISPGDSLYFLDPDGHKLEIHVGTWQTRLLVKKNNPGSWTQVEWFI